MPESFVDGWTAPVEYQLLSCGLPLNLTGATCVSLRSYGVGDVAVSMTGVVVVTSATGGIVEFQPGTSDLTQARALIHVRFKIVDATGKVSYCPSDEAETWTVRRI